MLERNHRPGVLGRTQIYELIDVRHDKDHVPVYIDGAGNLFVRDDLALTNDKLIPIVRYNIEWGLTHTPYRELFDMPDPYGDLAFCTSPIDVHQMRTVLRGIVNQERFDICYWIDYALHQRQTLKAYLEFNGKRLKWTSKWARPRHWRQQDWFSLYP